MKKPRRQFSAADKVAIVKAHLVDKVPVSDLCDKHQILPTQFYGWQKLFFENGAAAFDAASKRTPREDGSTESSNANTGPPRKKEPASYSRSRRTRIGTSTSRI